MAKSSQLEGILNRATSATPKAASAPAAAPLAEVVQLETGKPVVDAKPAPKKVKEIAAVAKVREPQKSVQAFVPASIDRALRMKAAEEGTTTRTLILRGLKAIGFDVAEEELRDKRGKA